jgi:hypothetical protein
MAGLGEPQATADAGLMTETRRFPPPGQIDETEACFIVRDRNGHALAYLYFEESRSPCCGQQKTRPAAVAQATFLAPIR